MTTVALLGDVMLGRGVAQRLRSTSPEDVWAPDLRDVLGRCDVVVANLECCISLRGRETRRIAGKPFFFRAPPAAIGCLEAIGARAVSLANNHALDYEEDALVDTLAHLAAAGIAVTGAGVGPRCAAAAAFVPAGEARMALIGVSDHPREYAARRGRCGVAWADLPRACPQWLLAEVARARREADLVVVFPHWGPNMTRGPAPWQRTRARELLDAGADLVAGHSAHVFHGIERVDDRCVLYDLGDTVDDYARDPVMRNDLGVLALWRPGGHPEIELVGLRLDFARTSLAQGADADWIAERLRRACAELGSSVRRLDVNRFAVEG
jgi:poly-gamma-glutamate synthesis protein (capsule biosynthesis protein)